MKRLSLFVLTVGFAFSAGASDEVKAYKSLEKAKRGAKITAPEFPTEVKPATNVDQAKVAKFRQRTLPPSKRDAVFRAAGVDSVVANWSEYDKDMLIVRAREFPADKFAKAYPDWDAGTCARVQAAAKQ